MLLHLFSEILWINPPIMVHINFLKQHIIQNETTTNYIILINSNTLTNTSNLFKCRCTKYTEMLFIHYHLIGKLKSVLLKEDNSCEAGCEGVNMTHLAEAEISGGLMKY